jgi:hypothetical protein
MIIRQAVGTPPGKQTIQQVNVRLQTMDRVYIVSGKAQTNLNIILNYTGFHYGELRSNTQCIHITLGMILPSSLLKGKACPVATQGCIYQSDVTWIGASLHALY